MKRGTGGKEGRREGGGWRYGEKGRSGGEREDEKVVGHGAKTKSIPSMSS